MTMPRCLKSSENLLAQESIVGTVGQKKVTYLEASTVLGCMVFDMDSTRYLWVHLSTYKASRMVMELVKLLTII